MARLAVEILPCRGLPARVAECLKALQAGSAETGFTFLDSGVLRESGQQALAGRYSILALAPWLEIRCQGDKTYINDQISATDLWTTIRMFLLQHAADLPDNILPAAIPFQAGLIGYFSYDLAAALDPDHLTLPAEADHDLPLAWLTAYDQMIVFDEEENIACLMAWGQLQPAEKSLAGLRACLEQALASPAEQSVDLAISHDPAHPSGRAYSGRLDGSWGPAEIQSNFSRLAYMEQIRKVRKAIGSGEVYILNLAQRLKLPAPADPFLTYLMLRQKSPTPYAAYVELPGLQILSFSPELFMRVTGRTVVTRPIKGTRPRGLTPESDAENRRALENSAKDRAELLMIVDLERNDLSRVCTAESVSVSDLYALESYATVFQQVATVSGVLAPGLDAVQCFAALFPGGSVTGAPKLRAMQLIRSFESVRRGLYTGCLGFFSLDGQAEFNILIRTIIHSARATTYHAGGGITWDSDPAAEYQETLDKTAAIVEVGPC